MYKQDPHRGVLVQLGSLTELSKWTQDRRPEGEGATQGDVRLLSRFAGLYGRGVLNLHHQERERVCVVFLGSSSSSVHGLSRRAYRSGLPLPPPGIFLTQGSKPCLLCLLPCRHSLPLHPLGSLAPHYRFHLPTQYTLLGRLKPST